MKKSLFLAALVAAFVACSVDDDPQAEYEVTFALPQFQVTTEAMHAPAALIDDDSQSMTDLYLFDGKTLVSHQTSSDENFGTITALLSAGEHSLHFIATRALGLNYIAESGALMMTSVRPTFGKHLTFNVNGSSTNNIELTRVSAQIAITIEDVIPSNAANLRFQFNRYCTALYVESFDGYVGESFDQTVNLSGKVGTADNTWRLIYISESYADGMNSNYTITATTSNGTVIGQATGTVPIKANTKTLLHGNLFSGTKSVLSISTAWNADIDVDM